MNNRLGLLFALITFAMLNSTSALALESKQNKYESFKCMLTADFGEMDGKLAKQFSPLSKVDNYRQSVQHNDLKASASYDEAGKSYTVEVNGFNGFYIKSTLPYYADAELRFLYDLHDDRGNIIASSEFIIQCTK